MAIKIMSVVGARPNFMKAGPIIAAIQAHNAKLKQASQAGKKRPLEALEHILVHTGQHYDDSMSGSFFADLGMPRPDVHLGVGSGSHAVQTAEIMRRFEEVVQQHRPDVLVVVGDVNSTVACALVAAKVSFDAAGMRPRIAHVEAGLRSFDRTMPEEHNRVLTDHLADLLFVTEASGLRNLRREGIASSKVFFVGNTMIDSLLAYKEKADTSSVHQRLGLVSSNGFHGHRPYALLTLHRPSNVDDAASFARILRGLRELPRQMPVIFPVHPRTQKRIQEFGLGEFFRTPTGDAGTGQRDTDHTISLVPPQGYLDFLCLMKSARLVVTDSGGIQEETTCLGIPCVTVRENTERPVTVHRGTNVLAGREPEAIRAAIRAQLRRKVQPRAPKFWDGKAAQRIVKVLAGIRSQA
jgi:UDP-N-acetylglucosamine 2-epimerase (non-hydrolysing)